MTQGRHAAPRHAAPAGARRATGGSRKATPPVRGRRAAERQSPITVLRAGSDLTVAAVAPLAALSAACVFGLGAAGSGDPASAQGSDDVQPKDRPTAAGNQQIGKHRAVTTASDATTAGQATSAAVTHTGSQGVVVVAGGSVPSATATPTRVAQPTTQPTTEPTAEPTASVPTTAVPTVAPTPTVVPTTDVLTLAEAEAQCLASGISALDVVGLADCVADLLP